MSQAGTKAFDLPALFAPTAIEIATITEPITISGRAFLAGLGDTRSVTVSAVRSSTESKRMTIQLYVEPDCRSHRFPDFRIAMIDPATCTPYR